MNEKRRAQAVVRLVGENGGDDDNLLHFDGDDMGMTDMSHNAGGQQLHLDPPKIYEGDAGFSAGESHTQERIFFP